jgi:hypothetical protein
MKSKIKLVLLNEAGQMSIFVALIFQVLFVFFAMVINIGLLVHDKINLQNAADLGAYYAAERQAEILNEIAHINYQMRQDYKLLTWRYRVLGTLGRDPSPADTPALSPPGTMLTDEPRLAPGGGAEEVPGFCVSHDMWQEFRDASGTETNFCNKNVNYQYPTINPPLVIAPWIGAAWVGQASMQNAMKTLTKTCDTAGPANWVSLMQLVYGYKQSVALRKQQIWRLRKMLVADEMQDLSMESVKVGVQKTIEKNLTQENHNGLEIELINGYAGSECANGAMPGESAIKEILTAPKFAYISVSHSCQVTWAEQAEIPVGANALEPSGYFEQLAKSEPPPTNPLHSSLGFEKNPWCMAYVGVKVKAKPHKPFAPFGQAIELTARAFAQPFGGRIGPWYMSGWSSKSDQSDSGQRVDPLTTPRLGPGGVGAATNNDVNSGFFPNFARYPGDVLGLRSRIAQGLQRQIFTALRAPNVPHMELINYTGFDQLGVSGDVLAWSPTDPPKGPPGSSVALLRQAEVSAVAPDLFDITYYSIDPHYYTTYLDMKQNWGAARYASMPQLNGVSPLPSIDIGARNDAGDDLQRFDIAKQITSVSAGSSGIDPQLAPAAYWVVRKWEHLLTGWISAGSANYSFPSDRFGKCYSESDPKVMIPGGCAAGGRVGYSVRLISRDHLLAATWKIGGDGFPQPGKIRNPPPEDF